MEYLQTQTQTPGEAWERGYSLLLACIHSDITKK